MLAAQPVGLVLAQQDPLHLARARSALGRIISLYLQRVGSRRRYPAGSTARDSLLFCFSARKLRQTQQITDINTVPVSLRAKDNPSQVWMFYYLLPALQGACLPLNEGTGRGEPGTATQQANANGGVPLSLHIPSA